MYYLNKIIKNRKVFISNHIYWIMVAAAVIAIITVGAVTLVAVAVDAVDKPSSNENNAIGGDRKESAVVARTRRQNSSARSTGNIGAAVVSGR